MLGMISPILKLLHIILGVSTAQNFPPPLEAREEEEAFRKARAGSEEDRQRLILHNLRLVSHIVRKYYATAKENLILYYIPVNGADLDEAFSFTSDKTGYIGIHELPDYDNMTAKTVVINGMTLMAERIDGVVVGTIGAGA